MRLGATILKKEKIMDIELIYAEELGKQCELSLSADMLGDELIGTNALDNPVGENLEKNVTELHDQPNKLSVIADSMPDYVVDIIELDSPIELAQEVLTNDFPAIKTRNQELVGQAHPETGVPFESKTVETSAGEKVDGVFPEFNAVFETELPDELLMAPDKEQFDKCNTDLNIWVENKPDESRHLFNDEQIADIKMGRNPEGYTWHHHEDKGRMQLVDTEVHAKTGHTGGKKVWGGGNEYR